MVLLGEHLGGREHRGLPARVDDGEHGAQRHHRLPAADLALEQAVHGVFGGEVGEDLGGDLPLALGEGEGEAVVEGGEEAVGLGAAGDGGKVRVGVAAAGEGDLEDEGLVPFEAGAGVLDVRLGVRAVDLEECLGQGGESAARAQGVREGSTASWALGRTVWRALPIFQDSSLAVAG
ncbi:hypothetical protein SHKM778_20330 [Streptomyces sp. KM77-8]|uniref:Uncharacterized protein n=1 Tax=Streptomyces haneummycinicus TaxID=3074435 RepID=A0AAT9HEB0_9ACTN